MSDLRRDIADWLETLAQWIDPEKGAIHEKTEDAIAVLERIALDQEDNPAAAAYAAIHRRP
jgi:hypothetical protein